MAQWITYGEIPNELQPTLLPCPFCGSDALPVWTCNGWMYLRCANQSCSAEMTKMHGKSNQSIKITIQNLAERWNLRVSASHPSSARLRGSLRSGDTRETNNKEGK